MTCPILIGAVEWVITSVGAAVLVTGRAAVVVAIVLRSAAPTVAGLTAEEWRPRFRRILFDGFTLGTIAWNGLVVVALHSSTSLGTMLIKPSGRSSVLYRAQ